MGLHPGHRRGRSSTAPGQSDVKMGARPSWGIDRRRNDVLNLRRRPGAGAAVSSAAARSLSRSPAVAAGGRATLPADRRAVLRRARD